MKKPLKIDLNNIKPVNGLGLVTMPEAVCYNQSHGNWEQYLAWVVRELKEIPGMVYSHKLNRLIKSIESGEGGG